MNFDDLLGMFRDIWYHNDPVKRVTFKPKAIWDILASEAKFDLIRLLHHVEKHEPGYGTVVVPKEGFSDNTDTHNAVLAWLQQQDVNIFNPSLHITRLEEALHPTCQKFE